MIAYFSRRLLFALFLVFAVSSASLILARLAGGDFVTQSLGIEARRETVEQARARLGLDKSIAAQYGDWLGRAVRLDFGRSLLFDRPVSDLIPERAANTALLALTALTFATLVGLPLGVVAGSRPAGALSAVIRGVSVMLLSLPPLLTSLFLMFIAARTGWMPIAGMRSAGEPSTGLTLDLLHHLIVPAGALALPLAAMFERLQAQAMADTIGAPFVLAAFARGVPRVACGLARRAEGGAAARGGDLRSRGRHAAERFVCRRSHHCLAWSRPADARRAAVQGHLSHRRLRRHRRGVHRLRQPVVRRGARDCRSAGCRALIDAARLRPRAAHRHCGSGGGCARPGATSG